MNVRAFIVFLWGCLIAAAAVAGETKETHIKIITDGDDGGFEWHSTDPAADFSDLEVGESKTITGEDGNVVIEKSRQVRVIKTDDAAGVTIISADEIDDETRSKIEAVLKDAGKDGEILFIDGGELGGDAQAHGDHDVRIIKKKVEKTN